MNNTNISKEKMREYQISNAIAYIIDLYEDDAFHGIETYKEVLKRYGLEDLTYGEGRFISESVSRVIG